MGKWFYIKVITYGQEMLIISVLFVEDVWNISFTLDMFDVYYFII